LSILLLLLLLPRKINHFNILPITQTSSIFAAKACGCLLVSFDFMVSPQLSDAGASAVHKRQRLSGPSAVSEAGVLASCDGVFYSMHSNTNSRSRITLSHF
jgi:hypothetical protein